MTDKYRLFRDGNMWCAIPPYFRNLQESPAGFGLTKGDAVANLVSNREFKSWLGPSPAPSVSEFIECRP